MDMYETYSFLLADSFMSSLILPIQGKVAFPAMLLFGGYNLYLMVFAALIGTTLAAIFNWILGRIIVTAVKYKPNGAKAEKALNFFRSYGIWILLLSWIPVIAPILTALTGAAAISFKRVIPVIFIVNLLYYSALAFIKA
jgi:membrane protein YqaA with SNARE-associated domain